MQITIEYGKNQKTITYKYNNKLTKDRTKNKKINREYLSDEMISSIEHVEQEEFIENKIIAI